MKMMLYKFEIHVCEYCNKRGMLLFVSRNASNAFLQRFDPKWRPKIQTSYN